MNEAQKNKEKEEKKSLVLKSANAKRVIKKAAFEGTAAVFSSSCWFAVLLRKGSTRVPLLGLYTLPWTRLFLQ